MDNNMVLERVYRYSKDNDIDIEVIQDFISKHMLHYERFNQMNNEYLGNAEILKQERKPNNKPDNRIVVSHGRYLVDMFDGYFIGKPVKVISDSDAANEKLKEFSRQSGIPDEDAELAKLASVYGYAIELIYQDEKANTKVTYLDPKESFIVYDDSVQHDKLFGVYYLNGGEKVIVYTASEIVTFELSDSGNLSEVSREQHPFDGVPMIEFLQNEERIGLFEPTISMINHYNKAISEKANDVDYFADAYLAILGAELDEEGISRIRDNRIINLFGTDDATKILVEFLDKPDGDTSQEHLLDRLEKKIFQMCKVTDLTDERFGNSTGVAKEMKLQDMSNQAMMKERKFQEGMDERYRLFFSVPLNGTIDDWLSLKYTFYRNLPQDIEREANVVRALSGIVSQETLLSYLSSVDNVHEEIERLETKEDTFSRFNIDEEEPINEEENVLG